MPENNSEKMYNITGKSLQKMLDYFSNRPYGEVFQLVNELVNVIQTPAATVNSEASPTETETVNPVSNA